RSKCTNCEQTAHIDYWSLDSEYAAVKAESCDDCHSYLKVLYQDKDPNVEPAADDLATLLLDNEMEEKGYARSGINPLLFPVDYMLNNNALPLDFIFAAYNLFSQIYSANSFLNFAATYTQLALSFKFFSAIKRHNA